MQKKKQRRVADVPSGRREADARVGPAGRYLGARRRSGRPAAQQPVRQRPASLPHAGARAARIDVRHTRQRHENAGISRGPGCARDRHRLAAGVRGMPRPRRPRLGNDLPAPADRTAQAVSGRPVCGHTLSLGGGSGRKRSARVQVPRPGALAAPSIGRRDGDRRRTGCAAPRRARRSARRGRAARHVVRRRCRARARRARSRAARARTRRYVIAASRQVHTVRRALPARRGVLRPRLRVLHVETLQPQSRSQRVARLACTCVELLGGRAAELRDRRRRPRCRSRRRAERDADASSSSRRRSATSPTSRCARSACSATSTSSRRRTRGRRASSSSHHGIRTPLVSYHEHNESVRTPELLERLEGGESVALVSEAGTPSISDPGYRLVDACDRGRRRRRARSRARRRSSRRSSCPGSRRTRSSSRASFRAGRAERRKRLAELASERRTLVLFEAPHRLDATLQDMLEHARRPARRAVPRAHEAARGGSRETSLSSSRRRCQRTPVKGELVLVVEGAVGGRARPRRGASTRRSTRIAAGESVREATRAVAEERGVPRRALYDRVLARRTEGDTP